MISMKLQDVLLLSETGAVLLPGIQNVLRAKRVPIKAMYQLSKIGKKLIAEVADFIEARTALVKELGEDVLETYKDESDREDVVVDGVTKSVPKTKTRPTGNLRVKPENTEEFLAKQSELLAVEVELDLRPVKLDEMGEPEGIVAADLLACSAFIVE
jgi:hypothetical protein